LRILAALLLASIAWGGTVELTHHHGARAAKHISASGGTNAPALVTEDPADEPLLQSSEQESSSSRSSSRSECLICQLHHNLATTLLSEPPTVDATETIAIRATFAVALQLSEFTANQHGRAPPAIL
jgi:hypothetical protein